MANRIVNGTDIISSGEVARILNVHNDTVIWMAEHGHLPFERTAGGHRRYHRRDIEEIARWRERGMTDDLTIARGLLKQVAALAERYGKTVAELNEMTE